MTYRKDDGRLTDEERLRAIEIMEGISVSHLDPERIGGMVARAAAAYLRDPENIAGFSGSVLLLVLVSRGRRIPLIPALMISAMGQGAGRMAWRSYKNLEIIAQAHKLPAQDA